MNQLARAKSDAAHERGRIVFHVGYMKTGSTSLQHNLLNDHPTINYLAANAQVRNDFRADSRTRQFVADLSGRKPGSAETADETWHNHIAPNLAGDRTNIISEEDVILQADDPDRLFARIKTLAPDTHILLVVRNQVDLIRSLYDMNPSTNWSTHEVVTFDDYLDWAFGENAAWFDRMKFHESIVPAFGHFPSARVHVLSFSNLFKGDRRDLFRLATLLQVEPADVFAAVDKPSANESQMHASRRMMRRILGPVHGSWFLPLPVLRAMNSRIGRAMRFRKTELTEVQRARIEGYFAEDNARFINCFGAL